MQDRQQVVKFSFIFLRRQHLFFENLLQENVQIKAKRVDKMGKHMGKQI